MATYTWTINGLTFEDTVPLRIRPGQRARLVFDTRSTMWHPMHLHGHTFQVIGPGGKREPRKDTAIVKPREPLTVDLVANNPGRWMLHCHNAYHAEAGMMSRLDYDI